jgi:hypothetical protein
MSPQQTIAELEDAVSDASLEPHVEITERTVKAFVETARALNADSLTVEIEEGKAKMSMSRRPAPAWVAIVGAVFLCFTLLSLFMLVTGMVPMSSNRILLNVWVAFCAAGSISFLGGKAAADGQIPIPHQLGGSPIKFSLAGGIAAFLIVLVVMATINH